MINFLIRNRLVLMIIDFLIMLPSGILLLVTNANIFGFLFIGSVLFGLVFATIDVELHDQGVEAGEIEEDNRQIL